MEILRTERLVNYFAVVGINKQFAPNSPNDEVAGSKHYQPGFVNNV